MKKLLTLFAILFWGTSLVSIASHQLGSEISYLQSGPNSYLVTYREYRDCAGANLSASIDLQVSSPGCNTGRIVTLNQVSQRMVNPFGASANASCLPASPFPLYEIVTFTGKVTFSTAEYACSDWRLSVNSMRTPSQNIVNPSSGNYYTEATIKLQNGLVNSSPEFDSINDPLMYVNKYQDHVLSMSAHDPDGDSLVYTLVPVLENANMPFVYNSFGGGQTGYIQNQNPQPPFNTTNNPQIAIFPPSVGYSYFPTFPILSYRVNWLIGYQVNVAQPYFLLDPKSGEIKFHSTVYHDSAAYWENRYLVALMVEEFRNINGVPTKIGSVRRETLIQVIDGGSNINPEVTTRMANNQTITSGSEIHLQPGTPLNLQIATADADSSNLVIISTNVTSVLPGATFIITNSNTPNIAINWAPTAAHVRSQPYYFQVQLRDNANPLRGVHTETFAVRVSNTGGVTGTKDDLALNAGFTAYPNPFSDELNFKFNNQTKAESIIIYNILGRQVDQISVPKTVSGEQHVKWQNAAKHAAGMYVAKLITADKTIQTLKFTKLQ